MLLIVTVREIGTTVQRSRARRRGRYQRRQGRPPRLLALAGGVRPLRDAARDLRCSPLPRRGDRERRAAGGHLAAVAHPRASRSRGHGVHPQAVLGCDPGTYHRRCARTPSTWRPRLTGSARRWLGMCPRLPGILSKPTGAHSPCATAAEELGCVHGSGVLSRVALGP